MEENRIEYVIDSLLKILLGALLFVSLLSIFCVISGMTYFFATRPPQYTSFCRSDDEVYLTILENIEQWKTDLENSDSNYLLNYLTLEVRGNNYPVSIEKQRSDNDMIAYVSPSPGWPASFEGSEGYIYITSNNMPDYWQDKYYTKRMDRNIYCYSTKSF